MNIGRTTHETATLDPEAAAAALGIQESSDERGQARTERRDAQRDQLRSMTRAAQTLHEMADCALWKGIVNGVSAGLRCACEHPSVQGQAVVTAISKGMEIANAVDPFGIAIAGKQADVRDRETDAEAARQVVQDASDRLSEAQRAQGSMTQLMQKLSESRNAARLASIRG